jgi:hypothetical protein
LPIWIVNHHEDAIAPRRIVGEDHLQIQESPELIKFVGLRWPVLLLPRHLGVVERKVVPLEVAGVVQDGANLLDGCDGRESELLTRGGVEEMELEAGIDGD